MIRTFSTSRISTMARTMSKPILYLIVILGLIAQSDLAKAQNTCDIHPSYVGKWYSFINGVDQTITVSSTKWGEYSCEDKNVHPTENDAIEGRNSTMLMIKDSGSSICLICLIVLWRTPNVLQYHMSDCINESHRPIENICGGPENIPQPDELTTAFRLDQQTTVDCSSTFDDVTYGFTLETPNGFCDSPNNTLTACEDVGSSYVNNELFLMSFGRCPDVPIPFQRHERFLCMGSWYSSMHGYTYKFAAVTDVLERDDKFKYKCLITSENQNEPDNTVRWGMSRFSRCDTLRSLYEVPYRFVFHRIPPFEPLVAPESNLPDYLSGSWISTTGYPVVNVFSINNTHIHVHPKCSPGTPLPENAGDLDFYLSCKKASGTRYMMSKYFLGKCNAELVCYDISVLDRGIVLFNIGKPFRYTPLDVYLAALDDSANDKFEQVCGDQAFERNRTERPNMNYLTRLY